MANEAVLIFETGSPIPFTVANGTGIAKGASLQLTDPFTASAAAANDQVAGIAASEKIASDGKTKLAVYREGIFKVTLSGAGNAGDGVVTAIEANMFKTSETDLAALSGSQIAGILLETGATGETVMMELRPQVSSGLNAEV